jgi:uncharacterized membrane protein
VIPHTRVVETNISVEEAMKFVISAGAVSPMGDRQVSPRRGLNLDDLFRDRAR